MKNLSFGKVLVFVLGLLLGAWIILTGVFGWATRSQVPAMVQSFNQRLAGSAYSSIQVSAELKSAGFFTSEYQVALIAAPNSLAQQYLAKLPPSFTLSVEHGPVLGLLSRSPVQFGWANARAILPPEVLESGFELFAQQAFPFGSPREQIDIGTFQQTWVVNALNQQQKMQVTYFIQQLGLPELEREKRLSQLSQMRFLPTEYDKTVISLPNARLSLKYGTQLAAELSLPVFALYEKSVEHDLITALDKNLQSPQKLGVLTAKTELKNVLQRLVLNIDEQNVGWIFTSRVGGLSIQKNIVDAQAGVFDQTIAVDNSDQQLLLVHKDGADTLTFKTSMDHLIGEKWLFGNDSFEFKNVKIQGDLTGFQFEMLKRTALDNLLNTMVGSQQNPNALAFLDVKALNSAQVHYALSGIGMMPQRAAAPSQTGELAVSLRTHMQPDAQENTPLIDYLHPFTYRAQQFDASIAIDRGLVEMSLSRLLSTSQPSTQVADHTITKFVDEALENLPLRKNAKNQITIDMQLIPDTLTLKINDTIFNGEEEIQSLLVQIDELLLKALNTSGAQ